MIDTKKIFNHLIDFENSETLKTIKNMADKGNQLMDKIDDSFHVEPLSIKQLLNYLSPVIDEKIIEQMKDTTLKPIGGELKLIAQLNNDILVIWDFYFINTQNKYIKIGNEKIIKQSRLTHEACEQIKSNVMVFDIKTPIQ